eukprot:317160_1
MIRVLVNQYWLTLGYSLDSFLDRYTTNETDDNILIQHLGRKMKHIRDLSLRVSGKNGAVIEELLFEVSRFKEIVEQTYLRTFLYKLMDNPDIPRNIHVFVSTYEQVE